MEVPCIQQWEISFISYYIPMTENETVWYFDLNPFDINECKFATYQNKDTSIIINELWLNYNWVHIFSFDQIEDLVNKIKWVSST